MSENLESEQKKQYPVKRVCAWCKKDLGVADYTSSEPGEITHTICEECEAKMRKGIEGLDDVKK